jgi:exodeoxyribonuclease-3
MDFLRSDGADILCIQETKASPEQMKNIGFDDYHKYHSSAMKKGYSGVSIWSRTEPLEVEYGLGTERFDAEGRTIIAHFDGFSLINCYFPNGKKNKERLDFKLAFYEAFIERAEGMRRNTDIVFCGDVNTAHKEMDLARPKDNETVSGFLPIERAWMDRIVAMGWVDTFRALHQEEVRYTWWDYKTRARERNIGWRIDYFFVNDGMMPRVRDSFMLPEMVGSDHCPIGIELVS